LALLKSLPVLSNEQQTLVLKQAEETLLRTKQTENNMTNWPASISADQSSDKKLVQWCHGAPGIITSFADFPIRVSDEVNEALETGGELVWKAGPLNKPFGLCHGTAGNGYAFLKLFRRTQDPKWLDRARSFAMHAIEQSDRAADEFGFYRYEVLTGDLGLAHFLWSCVQQESDWPLVDFI